MSTTKAISNVVTAATAILNFNEWKNVFVDWTATGAAFLLVECGANPNL